MKTKFYVMHYKQAPKRKDILQPKLDRMGIDAEWYTDYDQEDLTEEVIDELYSEDVELFRRRMNGWKTEEDYKNYKGITKSHLSLVIKFIKCIEIIAESDYDNVVFFEDDVVFDDGRHGFISGSKDLIFEYINMAEEIGGEDGEDLLTSTGTQQVDPGDLIPFFDQGNLPEPGTPDPTQVLIDKLNRAKCDPVLSPFRK